MEGGWLWWICMLLVSLFNIFLLFVSRQKVPINDSAMPKGERAVVRTCALIFTLVCAYRAVLPRIDVLRICWFDSPLNWVVFGRLAATVAEVAWATQMGVVLRRVATNLFDAGLVSRRARSAASLGGASIIAMACFAECWSWTNLITENNVFAVVEQALWMVLFVVMGVGVLLLLPYWPDPHRSYTAFAILVIAMGLEQGFEAFGMYLPRFIQDQEDGKAYEGLVDGFKRLAECAVVSRSMQEWSEDALWMTGYFSVGVWSSIWLALAPLPSTDSDSVSNVGTSLVPTS